MRLRDHRHSSDSRSKRRDHGKEQHPSPLSEEELDDLVRRILSRSLDKFDNGPPSSGTGRSRHERRSEADTSEEERNPARGSQSNELARLVLGYVAQFALKRYQERKKRKAANSSDYKKGSPARGRSAAKMPFLYGDGGRPLRSGERERMQRRRETGRSSPYDGASEIHLTDPLPPTPVPVVPPSTFLPPRDPAPEPKLRRRRRHSNLSGRQPAEAPRDPPSTQRPPLVIPPSPEDKPSQPPPPPPSLHRSHTWDSTPAIPPVPPVEPPPRTRSRSRYDDERPQERPGQSRSPYAYHPNYPIHDHDPYYNARPASRRHHHHHRTGPSDPLTPPVSPYRPPPPPPPPREDTLLRERERRIEKERDQDREQRQRDREYDKERRQRKEAERGRPGDGARISVERSREAALALSIDDLLRQLRSTDDLVYRTVYRPTVEKYDERAGAERGERGERCSSCRSIIMQSADLQRAIARARSSALAVRDLLDAALLEDRRKRRRPTVQFVSEQTM